MIISFMKQYGTSTFEKWISQRSLAAAFPQLPSIELQGLEQPIAQKLNLLLHKKRVVRLCLVDHPFETQGSHDVWGCLIASLVETAKTGSSMTV